MKEMNTKLKQCPFCGSYDVVSCFHNVWDLTYQKRHYVECMNCGASTDEYKNEECAIEAWNRRVDSGSSV